MVVLSQTIFSLPNSTIFSWSPPPPLCYKHPLMMIFNTTIPKPNLDKMYVISINLFQALYVCCLYANAYQREDITHYNINWLRKMPDSNKPASLLEEETALWERRLILAEKDDWFLQKAKVCNQGGHMKCIDQHLAIPQWSSYKWCRYLDDIDSVCVCWRYDPLAGLQHDR